MGQNSRRKNRQGYHAPNGQPYLFVLAGTIQCFVRPKGGL